jgi:hypothetical protein
MGILVHGCIGGPVVSAQVARKLPDPDIDDIDKMTSEDSTLPYNDDKMQKMITLVKIAKGRLLCQNGIAVTGL